MGKTLRSWANTLSLTISLAFFVLLTPGCKDSEKEELPLPEIGNQVSGPSGTVSGGRSGDGPAMGVIVFDDPNISSQPTVPPATTATTEATLPVVEPLPMDPNATPPNPLGESMPGTTEIDEALSAIQGNPASPGTGPLDDIIPPQVPLEGPATPSDPISGTPETPIADPLFLEDPTFDPLTNRAFDPAIEHPEEIPGLGRTESTQNPLPPTTGTDDPFAANSTVENGSPSLDDLLGTTPLPPVPGHGPATSEPEEPPFDPIKENGPIFVQWPIPQVALILTGAQHGYIEPCGCAGLDRMKGGMSRRHALFKDLAEWGWPTIGLDVGGTAKGFGRQSELKFHTMYEGMRKAGFDAVALGKSDLQLTAGSLVAESAVEQPALMSANVGLFGFDADLNPTMSIIERGGKRFAVTSVLSDSLRAQINNDELEMRPAAEALAAILPKLKEKNPDHLILLAHATMDETNALIARFPDFDIVVTSDGPPEPPPLPIMAGPEGKTMLIQVGEKGMNVVVLGFYDNPSRPIRYQRVPLDSRFGTSEEMTTLMTFYQDQIKNEGLRGLGIRAIPHPLKETSGEFVGSKRCESCHEPSYDVWRKSGHAHAFKTLQEKQPPRNFDPECISCHVVGWHPTSYFPYESGYVSENETPELIDVGCESCHGPGQKHVEAEKNSKDLAILTQYRKAVTITREQAKDRTCITCHDGDNSPEFRFDTYWPKISHSEDD